MRTIILFALLAIFVASCTTAEFIQHTPTLANTGQHTGKGQINGKLLYSSGNSTSNSVVNSQGASPYEKVRGTQAQASFSVNNSLALQASFMHSSEQGGSKESGQTNIVYRYNRNVTEGGLAFYDNLNEQKTLFIELGAGTGLGSFKATEAASVLAPGGRYYNHNVFKLYLQPSVYFVSKNIYFTGGLKFSYISFNGIKTTYSDLERTNRSLTTGNSLNTTTLDFFTKADVFLTKVPWLGLNGQLLLSSDLGKKFNYNQTDNNFGIGLSFRFGQLNEEKK